MPNGSMTNMRAGHGATPWQRVGVPADKRLPATGCAIRLVRSSERVTAHFLHASTPFANQSSNQALRALCLRRLIENLDYKVNDDDIKELFEPFGGLAYSSVHWGNECVPQTHA